MIKYKIRPRWNTKIIKKEIKRETDHFYFFESGRREKKVGWDYKYFDSWEDAHNSLLKEWKRKIKIASNNLKHRIKEYRELKTK